MLTALGFSWFALSIVIAISLFATVTALIVQYFVAQTLASITIDRLVAVAAVVVFSGCQAAK
jgi:hypothetical protein